MKTVSNKTVQQFTVVYHIEYGKGRVMRITHKDKDALVMVYFQKAKVSDWALLSVLRKDIHPLMSLNPLSSSEPTDQVSDSLQAALENLLGGGFK